VEAITGASFILNLKLRIACQFLHFAKTEDIWLKSALKVERSVLLTSGRKREDRGGKKKRERRF
jgi:hypothetical protein